MSDTVYENPGLDLLNGETITSISATRFWGGAELKDCIQVTLKNDFHVMFSCITLEEFHDMVRAVDRNVEENKDAFWHTLCK
jgi:hypothetical protein